MKPTFLSIPYTEHHLVNITTVVSSDSFYNGSQASVNGKSNTNSFQTVSCFSIYTPTSLHISDFCVLNDRVRCRLFIAQNEEYRRTFITFYIRAPKISWYIDIYKTQVFMILLSVPIIVAHIFIADWCAGTQNCRRFLCHCRLPFAGMRAISFCFISYQFIVE